MNKKLKYFLIVSGYIIVFILTFVLMGGLNDLYQFATESTKALEEIIIKMIAKLRGILP